MPVVIKPAISGQQIQQEALNNLDFESYKQQIYLAREKEKKMIQNYKFNDNYSDIKSDISNSYLFTGILLIVFAITMLIIA